MTFRLTCLLIFTLLLASPIIVYGDSSSTSEPTTEQSSTQAPAVPPTTAASTNTCPSGLVSHDHGCSVTCSDINGQAGVCLRGLKQDGGKATACCTSLEQFCPHTHLFSWHSLGDGSYKFEFDVYVKNLPNLWYKRNFLDASPSGVACPIPNSFTLTEHTVPNVWKNGLDKDAETGNSDKSLKTCQKNSECEDGEFCDAVFNPTFEKTNHGLDQSGPNKKSLRFCYPLPPLDESEMYEGQKLHHVEHENGLKICTIDRECGKMDEICHQTGSQYRNESNLEAHVPGICVTVDACGKSDVQTRGVLNAGSQKCLDDDNCQGAGVSNGNSDHNPHCRNYWKSDKSRKVCCFEKNPSCRVGKAVTPFKKCKQTTDCTGDLLKVNTWNHWCDDSGLNICCKDLTNSAWQCPDLSTPLFNEPKCTGVIKGKENSGSCPKKGGRCLRGHCCPPLLVKSNGTEIELGRNLYKTEFDCNPDTAVPNGFSYAFCNPEDKKLIIMGRYHDNGDKMTKVSGKKCTINADCSSDASSVCVYENSQTHVCYFNPLRPLRPPVSSFWKTVLIISLVCGGIFLVLSLVCFVCYRSKSVFDKYKKKGKKGKGSSGKSSKGSKKGGKKGGKKGKKGKKGEESASSKSKKSKSKTKSKKETEKSDGTTGDGSTSSQIN